MKACGTVECHQQAAGAVELRIIIYLFNKKGHTNIDRETDIHIKEIKEII